MSEALSKAERENIIAHVGLMAPWDHMGGTLKAWVGDYEATVCQLERGLAAVTAERDAAQAELARVTNNLDALIVERGILADERDAYKRVYDTFFVTIGPPEEMLRQIIASAEWLEARGVSATSTRDAQHALEALLALQSQLSGNSGGFEAAAGILADTWDGEKSEVTIRRLRDGMPAEEELP